MTIPPHPLEVSAARLRALADRLDADGDADLAATVRRAADEVDAEAPCSPPCGGGALAVAT